MNTIESSPKELLLALLDASEKCVNPRDEEGGIILERENDYCFCFVNNYHAGTKVAVGLYEAEAKSLALNVFPKIKEGWKMFGSFHTHPLYTAAPSHVDLTYLFQGFSYNAIYAPRYDTEPSTFSITLWDNNQPKTTHITKNQILEKIKPV